MGHPSISNPTRSALRASSHSHSSSKKPGSMNEPAEHLEPPREAHCEHPRTPLIEQKAARWMGHPSISNPHAKRTASILAPPREAHCEHPRTPLIQQKAARWNGPPEHLEPPRHAHLRASSHPTHRAKSRSMNGPPEHLEPPREAHCEHPRTPLIEQKAAR